MFECCASDSLPSQKAKDLRSSLLQLDGRISTLAAAVEGRVEAVHQRQIQESRVSVYVDMLINEPHKTIRDNVSLGLSKEAV